MVTAQQRNIVIFDLANQVFRRGQALGDNETADTKRTEVLDVFCCFGRIPLQQFGQITEFCVTEDLDPIGVKVLGVACQGQSRLLYSRHLYNTAQATPSGQQLQIKPGLRLGQQF